MSDQSSVPNPPAGHQRIIPYMTYQDAAAAIEFLCRCFGFEEVMRLETPKGAIAYAELSYGGNVIMLSSEWPNSGMVSPQKLDNAHCQISCYVEDVDAHHAHAEKSGVSIAGPPKDQFYGARTYRATDCEGHRWLFSQPTKVMTAEEIRAAMGG